MILMGIFVYYMIVQDTKRQFEARWHRKNKLWLGIVLLLLPFQIFLFSSGEPHGTSDQIGVILALFQIFFIGLALKAYKVQWPDVNDAPTT